MVKDERAKRFKVIKEGQEVIMEIHTEEYDKDVFMAKFYKRYKSKSGEEVEELVPLAMIDGNKIWVVPSREKEECIQAALKELIKYFEQHQLDYKEID